jgi:hypothetical protein
MSLLAFTGISLLMMAAYTFTEGKPIGEKIDRFLKRFLLK